VGARRKGRELALQMLYQWDVSREPVENVIESSSELQRAGDAARAFASRLVEGTVDRVEEIDKILIETSEHWRLGRMSTVDRNVLRLAVYELLTKSTPPGVVINEALEVAKRFSSPESAGFVNGILDAVNEQINAKAQGREGAEKATGKT
jgi:N utilization substance protein B